MVQAKAATAAARIGLLMAGHSAIGAPAEIVEHHRKVAEYEILPKFDAILRGRSGSHGWRSSMFQDRHQETLARALHRGVRKPRGDRPPDPDFHSPLFLGTAGCKAQEIQGGLSAAALEIARVFQTRKAQLIGGRATHVTG